MFPSKEIAATVKEALARVGCQCLIQAAPKARDEKALVFSQVLELLVRGDSNAVAGSSETNA